jgi:hypothetical protein
MWDRVRQLRTDAHQIASYRGVDGSSSFDRYVKIRIVQYVREPSHFRSNHRFAAGDYDMVGVEACHISGNLIDRKIFSFRAPGGVWRVAPGTTEIAPRCSYKN